MARADDKNCKFDYPIYIIIFLVESFMSTQSTPKYDHDNPYLKYHNANINNKEQQKMF